MTRILGESLQGTGRVAVICCIGPSIEHFEHTKRTLEFGSCARKIAVQPKVNMEGDNALILKYQSEIDGLKVSYSFFFEFSSKLIDVFINF